MDSARGVWGWKMKEFIKNSECFFKCIYDIVNVKSRRHVLDAVVEDVRDYLDCDRCTLFIYDKSKHELYSRVAQKLGKRVVRIPADNHSITGHTFLTGETVYVNDAYDEKELKSIDPGLEVSDQWDKAYKYKTRSVLSTPIIARGKTVGVFLALNKTGGFLERSAEAVKEYAPILGLALEIVLLDEAIHEGRKPEDMGF